MDDTLTRIWTDLVARLTGPMAFRFILQPVMGALLATRDGIKDAREGRPPYFWTIFTRSDERGRLLEEGSRNVKRVLVLGVVMEVIYQLMVLRWIYIGELILVVLSLAFVPYLMLRGVVNRIARHWIRPKRAVVL